MKICLQEYIKEAGGADIRCFVVGDKVIAAMKRQAKPEYNLDLLKNPEGDRGKKGGGATLTPLGLALVSRYRAMERAATAATEPHLKALAEEIAKA